MKKNLPMRALVLGGASSGKSLWAENLVKRYDLPKHYIATAQAWDDEMRAKIDAHKDQRGPGWMTHEAPLDLPPVLDALPQNGVTLLDCATLWLSNQLLAEVDINREAANLISALKGQTHPIIVVSNEVGQGVVPDYALGRRFRDAQGRLNRDLADWAELVVFVIAGLPLVLKGDLP